MNKNKSEVPRPEYSYWKQAKDIFLNGIDKNKTIPEYSKQELKELVDGQFQFLGKIIGTYELMYLREKQSLAPFEGLDDNK